jgi:hypothetical protein
VVSGVRNPVSTRPSGSFQNARIDDKDQNKVLIYTGTTNPIQTSIEGLIKVANITQGNKESDEWNPYTLTFLPLNSIPSTGAIQVSWPPQVSINNN